MSRWYVVALTVACAASPRATWTPAAPPTRWDLVSVWCTPDGVSARDSQGVIHALRGLPDPNPPPDASQSRTVTARLDNLVYRAHDTTLERSTDGGKTWTPLALPIERPRDLDIPHPERFPVGGVPWGDSYIVRITIGPGGTRVFVVARFTVVGNSLEDNFVYLLRSDDRGATWSQVWTGPNTGPASHDPDPPLDVGGLLVALPDGSLAMNAVDGSILLSQDNGKTFVPRPTPARYALADLSADRDGTLRGVGSFGAIVVSTDHGKTFTLQPSGTTAHLSAIADCGGSRWIVGVRGTVLHD